MKRNTCFIQLTLSSHTIISHPCLHHQRRLSGCLYHEKTRYPIHHFNWHSINITTVLKSSQILDLVRRTDVWCIRLLKAPLNHQIFMFFGHNVPIYCSKLASVRKRNKDLDEAFNGSITHDSM